MSIGRARILGGCSTHNGQVWGRGDQRDYDYVSKILGLNAWGFEDVLPYFMKIENHLKQASDIVGQPRDHEKSTQRTKLHI